MPLERRAPVRSEARSRIGGWLATLALVLLGGYAAGAATPAFAATLGDAQSPRGDNHATLDDAQAPA